MDSAAISGLSTSPKAGSKTPAAIGTPTPYTPATLCSVRLLTECSPSWSTQQNVAFEIDDIDQVHGTGWSVVARRGRGGSGANELVRLWTQPGVVPWAPGTRNLWIGISIKTISGRRFKAPFVD
jgi:hypothetical protein